MVLQSAQPVQTPKRRTQIKDSSSCLQELAAGARALHLICTDAKDVHDAAEGLLNGAYAPVDALGVAALISKFRQQVQDFTQIQLEDELMSFVENVPNQKSAELFAWRFGFQGQQPATLQELADEHRCLSKRAPRCWQSTQNNQRRSFSASATPETWLTAEGPGLYMSRLCWPNTVVL